MIITIVAVILVVAVLTVTYRMHKVAKLKHFLAAVSSGNVDDVRAALKRGVDVNAFVAGSRPAIILAAVRGYAEMVKMLMEHGANVHTTDGISRADALQEAVSALGIPSVARPQTPLLGRLCETILLMLRAMDEAEVQSFIGKEDGARAFVSAASCGHSGLVDYFLQKGYKPDESCRLDFSREPPAIHHAAYANQLDIVRLLLQHGADPRVTGSNVSQTPPLHWAALNGNLEMVKLLYTSTAHDNDYSRMARDNALGIGKEVPLKKEIEDFLRSCAT
jgi:hypothetical protein